ncbi:MAG: DUF362 domain-containing protein [Candidatus Woesearchaeota archaeon]
MEKVAVKKCSNYYDENLYNKVKQTIDLLGGIEKFINKGEKVVLKVNLLMGKDPKEGVTTHPEIVRAVARLVKNQGAIPIIADSPGGPFNNMNLKRAYRISGFEKIAEEENIELNYNTDSRKINFNEGKIKKSFEIADYINKSDKVINLAKLKTHGLTMYTGGVKNLFGTIPGLLKAEYHLSLEDIEYFSEMLVDLAKLIKPQLTLIDGILGMEGDGPSGGETKNFNYLLTSISPFAVDVAAVHLMGIFPTQKVPTILAAKNRNEVAEISDLDFLGDKLVIANDTRIPSIEKKSNLLDQKLPDPISNFLAYFLRSRPVFDSEKCVGCGDCVESCPPQTIELKNSKAVVDLSDCIRCFCCQELCSYNAVKIKRPLLSKLFFS